MNSKKFKKTINSDNFSPLRLRNRAIPRVVDTEIESNNLTDGSISIDCQTKSQPIVIYSSSSDSETDY